VLVNSDGNLEITRITHKYTRIKTRGVKIRPGAMLNVFLERDSQKQVLIDKLKNKFWYKNLSFMTVDHEL